MFHTRKIFLNPKEVSLLEGVTPRQVSTWCEQGFLWPCQRIKNTWVIPTGYKISIPPEERIAIKRSRGRPPGSKNKYPYPKNVKRPRKAPLSASSMIQQTPDTPDQGL